MTQSIDDILAEAEPPEAVVALCMRGSLVAQYERLGRQFAVASTVADSLGDEAPATVIAREMAELHDQMVASEREFRLRAMPPKKFSDLYARKPDEPKPVAEGEPISDEVKAAHADAWHTWTCALLAATCYDPSMTAAKADKLSAKLSNAQWVELTDTAFNVNAGRQKIPFSAAVSAHLQRIAPK